MLRDAVERNEKLSGKLRKSISIVIAALLLISLLSACAPATTSRTPVASNLNTCRYNCVNIQRGRTRQTSR